MHAVHRMQLRLPFMKNFLNYNKFSKLSEIRRCKETVGVALLPVFFSKKFAFENRCKGLCSSSFK